MGAGLACLPNDVPAAQAADEPRVDGDIGGSSLSSAAAGGVAAAIRDATDTPPRSKPWSVALRASRSRRS